MWTAKDRERYKEDGRRYPSDLTDAEWELARSLFEWTDLQQPDADGSGERNLCKVLWTDPQQLDGNGWRDRVG